MTPDIQPELLLASLPLIAAWVWWVDKKVAAHEAVIKRIDMLVQLMLEDRLDRKS